MDHTVAVMSATASERNRNQLGPVRGLRGRQDGKTDKRIVLEGEDFDPGQLLGGEILR
jgi:hypothetical protein